MYPPYTRREKAVQTGLATPSPTYYPNPKLLSFVSSSQTYFFFLSKGIKTTLFSELPNFGFPKHTKLKSDFLLLI